VRTALVTGGTGGMGRVIAAQLAADGFDVAVAYAGSVEEADATVKEIAGHGRRGAAFAADIADADATAAVFDAVEDRFGHLDVVVHTAGINRPAVLADLDLADLDEIHRVNVRGTDGRRLDRHGAGRAVRKVARRASLGKAVTPHTLRHAFITAALDAGVPLRDVQEAASHADPRTTMRYDRARSSLDRHATYIVAAYVAGAAR
jgi:NAD(P)-dependent dehydrogenase (short-subunit alcohol dehydrogenase family)